MLLQSRVVVMQNIGKSLMFHLMFHVKRRLHYALNLMGSQNRFSTSSNFFSILIVVKNV